MKVLVLGGTGLISGEIVRQLMASEHEVVIYNRGNKDLSFTGKVKQITGDRRNREEFEIEMKKREFDVVIDMICYNEEDARSTIRAFAGDVEQIIITSSVAAYKRPYNTVPTVEAAEELWDDPVFPYAFNKGQVERYLQSEIEEKGLPITIIRPSLTFGRGATNVGVFRQNYGIVDRIRKGKPLVMFGDGTTPWSFTFTPDLARAYLGVIDNEKTYGEAYHVSNEDRQIWEDLYLEFGKIVGVEPEIVHVPAKLLYKAAPSLCNHLYFEKTYPGLFDNSKIKRDVPEYQAEISLHEGLKILVDWYEEEAHQVDPAKDELEDKIISIYKQCAEQMTDLY